MAADGTAVPGRSILFNFSWSAIHVLVTRAVRFLMIAWCIRQVGAAGWGQVASAFVVLGFLFFLVDQGLGLVPPLYRVGDAGLDRALLIKITAYRTAMAVLVVGAVHAWDAWLHPLDGLVLLFSWVLIPRAWNLDWWFQRREIFHVASGLATAKVVFFAAAILLLIRPGTDPSVIVAAELGTETAGALLAWILWRRNRRAASPSDGPGTAISYGTLLLMAQPLLWIGLLNTIHQSIDLVFLKYLQGYRAVGEYDVGYKIGYFFFFMGATLVQIIRPRLVIMQERGSLDAIGPLLAGASRILSFSAACFMAFSFHFAGPVLSLFFGGDAALTVFVFRWTPLWVATAFMTMLCADTLLGLGRKRQYLVGALLCALVNVAANFALITAFGSKGALFATLLAEAVFFAYAFVLLPAPIRRALSRPFLRQGGTLAALAAVYAGWGDRLPAAALLGLSLAVLALLAWTERPVGRGTLSALKSP